MSSASSEPESLATLHILTALLRSLRHEGVLGTSEINQVLERAAWPLRHREDERARHSVELIDHVRIEMSSE